MTVASALPANRRRPTITRLEPDPGHPGAVHVHADGKRFCTIPLEAIEPGALQVGRTIDQDLEERLGHAADEEAAFRTALRALGRRSFARADLSRRLRRKGHPAVAVEPALDRAARLGLVDDALFAERYCEAHAARGKGPVRLMADLRRVGVEMPHITRALEAVFPPGSDLLAQPRVLAQKRAAQLSHLPRRVQRRRVLAYLARRGYRGHEVVEVVREVIDHAPVG